MTPDPLAPLLDWLDAFIADKESFPQEVDDLFAACRLALEERERLARQFYNEGIEYSECQADLAKAYADLQMATQELKEAEAHVAALTAQIQALRPYVRHVGTCEIWLYPPDAQLAVSEHVCGLMGYNPMIDPPCPGCLDRCKDIYRRPECTCGLAALLGATPEEK